MGQATCDALTAIADGDSITDDVVAGLRQAVYADGEIDAGEARRLLQLHATAPVSTAAWADFFVEAVADYFVLQREAPLQAAEIAPNYLQAAATALKAATFQTGELIGGEEALNHSVQALTADDADALIMAFKAEGRLALDATERRLLARLFDRCVELPEALRRFAVDAVYATVMDNERVEADEAALLRRILWGPAGDEGIAICRREAEVLFAIANKTSRAENAPGVARCVCQRDRVLSAFRRRHARACRCGRGSMAGGETEPPRRNGPAAPRAGHLPAP